MECLKMKFASCTLLVLLALAAFQAEGLSFEDSKEGRESYYNFLVETRANGRAYNGKEIKGPCKDRSPKSTCEAYKPLCGTFKILKDVCPETCGMCRRANGPIPPCSATKFGCCWDNVTISLNPEKEGCPACIDYHPDCKYVKDRCAERAPVRRLCPKTCGVQCGACEDDPYQADVCKYYKMAGFCEVDPELMKKHCKKTCGLCH